MSQAGVFVICVNSIFSSVDRRLGLQSDDQIYDDLLAFSYLRNITFFIFLKSEASSNGTPCTKGEISLY